MDGWQRNRAARGVAVLAAVVAACGDAPTDFRAPDLECSIATAEIFNGQVKDAIPALLDPPTSSAAAAATAFLRDDDRVIGLMVDGAPLAVPLNILWHHEIVNLTAGALDLAVTHCPLTGSSLAFDRSGAAGAEFGVSGLLYRNNLLMYDRSAEESLWPQMARGARCGSRDGTPLAMHPVVEMRWSAWRTLHPTTRVVGSDTGWDRDYTVYPYGDYDDLHNAELLYPLTGLDPTRPPKERVLGLPDGRGGVAYPFGVLAEGGERAVVQERGHVVFWDATAEAAAAFRPEAGGRSLTFVVEGAGIVDVETGSVWSVDGRGVAGPLAGAVLEPMAEAYVAFWFAWAAFQPEADLWEGA